MNSFFIAIFLNQIGLILNLKIKRMKTINILTEKIFIFIRSTLGFEAWSRNERAISFAERKINKLKEFYIDPTRKLKKKGFFYTNNMNQNEFKRLMDNLFSKNQIIIKKETNKLKNYFLIYDYNNKTFRKYLKK